ncbi:MAG: hypothetical protein AB1726_13005 [Planctomycetota bacterium]
MRRPFPPAGPGLAALAPLLAAATAPSDTLATVPGRVVDLGVDGAGELLYCTAEREVGTISLGGVVTVLADAGSGPIPYELRAVVEDPNGDVAVLDRYGNIRRLAGGAPPAVLVYSNLYIVQDPSDMIVDAAGNYVLACATPTSGVRSIDWISPDGARWAYYLVRHSPIQLAADPLTSDLVLAEQEAGGGLWLVDTAMGPHSTTPLDTTSDPGFTAAAGDGDVAVETDGDLLFVAGGTVWRHARASGTTSVLASGYPQLRGIAIAASSGNVPSASGWSAYLAAGEVPTAIREIGNVGAPAALRPPSLGWVPGRGYYKTAFSGIKIHELAADLGGDLLVGGDLYGSTYSVRRVDIPSFTVTTIADEGDGISGSVEGIAVAPDGTIYALTRGGAIHAIRESPFQVTTVFANALGEIGNGKDLVLGRDGKLYVADSDSWDAGEVWAVSIEDGRAEWLASTQESRGLSADPFTGELHVTEWVASGFAGEVGRLDPATGSIALLPGFQGMNYTNAQSWGDGDTAVLADGSLFTVSEDDWSLAHWRPNWQGYYREGSGFLNHPSGVAVAPSAPSEANVTGWSLYIAEYDNLWELKNTTPPAPVLVDPAAPPVGAMAGYFDPQYGRPRAMIADPAGGGLLVTTDAGVLLRLNVASGATSVVASAPQGLAGDLMALAATSTGRIVVAAYSGIVYEVDPAAGWTATVLFANSGGELSQVRGLCVDGLDRAILVDRPAGSAGGRVYRLAGGSLTLLVRTARGMRPAIDPLTADVFVTEKGTLTDGVGEVLRIEELVDPPTAGHYRGDAFFTLSPSPLGGDLAFDADGNFYVALGDEGRVVRVNRAEGTRTVATGNGTRPVGLALAPGRPGYAGAQGTSLFVLDEWVVWETGVDGLPAPPPPSAPPGLAPPADLRVSGRVVLGQSNAVVAQNPATPGKLYWILPSVSGKVPGIPLSVMGDPTDDRVLPSNLDELWFQAGTPAFPFLLGVLDGAGASAPGAAVAVPNDPALLDLGLFLDLTWVVLDSQAQNKVALVGGTTQLWFGQ